jgi:hypothetical protein
MQFEVIELILLFFNVTRCCRARVTKQLTYHENPPAPGLPRFLKKVPTACDVILILIYLRTIRVAQSRSTRRAAMALSCAAAPRVHCGSRDPAARQSS